MTILNTVEISLWNFFNGQNSFMDRFTKQYVQRDSSFKKKNNVDKKTRWMYIKMTVVVIFGCGI